MKTITPGDLITHSIKLKPHELDTIMFFIALGKTIELIRPSNTPHNKQGDFLMDSLIWESKTPFSNDRRSLERTFYRASQQSPNIIIDLRKISLSVDTIKTLEKCFNNTRRVRNMYIITPTAQLNTYKK